MQIDSEKVKEYLAKGGQAILELARDVYDNAGDRAFADAIEIGIANTISALYEANVKDVDIINLMNNHWGICRDEAVDLLAIEKIDAPCRAIKLYLRLQGKSSKEILDFMIYNGVRSTLEANPELRELRREPAKLYEALKSVK